MFAYVRYIEDDVCKIVHTTKIKKFDKKNIQYDRKYLIEWENKEFYQAHIILVRESKEDLENEIARKRVPFINKHLLKSDVGSSQDDSEDERMISTVKKKNLKKKSVVSSNVEKTILNEFEKDCNDNETTVKFDLEKKVENLEEKIEELKEEVKDKNLLIKELTNLNINLQKEVININKDLINKLETNKGLVEGTVNRNEELPKVGKIVGNQIHLGQGVYIQKDIYDSVTTLSSSPSQFVKNLSMAVFGAKVLKESSVTGRQSNRMKYDARPPLNPTKLQAIYDIFRHYLVAKGTTEILVDVNVQKVGSYISRKISDLNRKKKTVAGDVEIISEEGDDEEGEGEGDREEYGEERKEEEGEGEEGQTK